MDKRITDAIFTGKRFWTSLLIIVLASLLVAAWTAACARPAEQGADDVYGMVQATVNVCHVHEMMMADAEAGQHSMSPDTLRAYESLTNSERDKLRRLASYGGNYYRILHQRCQDIKE